MTDEEMKRLEVRYSDMESWDDAKCLLVEVRRLRASLTAAQLQSESRGKALQAELEKNRRLVALLSRAREAINEEAWTVLDEELRAAIEGSKR